MTIKPHIYVAGTCDTKGPELRYAADLIDRAGAKALIADVSTTPSGFAADISADAIAAFHPDGPAAVLGLSDRGQAVAAMAQAFARFMLSRNDVAGLLGMGGSGNSTIVSGNPSSETARPSHLPGREAVAPSRHTM